MAIKDISKILKNEEFLKGITGGKVVGAALNLGFGIAEYKDQRSQGNSSLGAATHAVGTMAINEFVGLPTMFALGAVKFVPKIAVKTVEGLGTLQRQMNSASRHKPFGNATFNDTPQAMTMRQVGMQLASASQYNLQQSMLGNEASYMHL